MIQTMGEVVFMLDTSASMNGHDKDRLAVDAVRQAFYSIPSNYKIDMPDAQQKEDARLLYEKMARAAKEKGIVIYIIASGSEWNETEAHIFDGAELTDGIFIGKVSQEACRRL